MNEQILVSKAQFYDMLDKATRYEALKAAGVDNWEGYAPAMKALSETMPNLPGDTPVGDGLRQTAAVDSGTPAT